MPYELRAFYGPQGTLQFAHNVLCTDRDDGAATPLDGPPALARFSVLTQLGLRHAHRGSLGGHRALCTWLPASLRVRAAATISRHGQG